MSAKGKVNILLVDDQPGKPLTYEAMLHELDENLTRSNDGCPVRTVSSSAPDGF